MSLHEARALGVASPRFRRAVAPVAMTAGARFYVCGGASGSKTLRSAERYDPKSQQWESLPPMGEARRCAAAAAAGGLLYICGGSDGSTAMVSAERLDVETGTWEQLAAMSTGRVWASAGAIDGRVYVCGGSQTVTMPHGFLRSAECFCPEAGQWLPLPPMQVARRCAMAAVVRGCLYVCGGSQGLGPLASVERYVPRVGNWEALAPMPEARRNAACCAAAGKVYIFGGEHQPSSSRVLRLDPETWQWEKLLTETDADKVRWWGVAGAIEGRIHFCGGTDGACAFNSAESLDPARGVWEALPPPRQGRVAAASVVIADRDTSMFL